MRSMEASRLGGEWPAPLQICMSVCYVFVLAGALQERFEASVQRVDRRSPYSWYQSLSL